MPIRVLPDEVASQIAAGEVVQRPASVVKELLENSLDAGAREVSVHVQRAGRRLIEVADDGCGIPGDELPLAVSRHATSKLSRAEELGRITSLGFRGEALASIASVSLLTITSRTREAEMGARLQVDAGRLEPLESVGAPPGTAVRVGDLFFNVPARLKFLKSDSTERRHIDELVTRYALAYPQVRVRLVQDGRTVLQTSGQGDRREVLAALYGVEVARKLLALDAAYEDLRLTGFISPITLTRSNRREITYFVNGRWVQDPALSAALIQAYHTLLTVGRYPLAALFLELSPEAVDVNVHPAKAEVRFREKDRVFAGVQRAVRRALLAHTPVPAMGSAIAWGAGEPEGIGSPAWGEGAPWQAAGPEGRVERSDPAGPSQGELPTGKVPLLRVVGQVGAAYVVAEGPDGLYLIDQHAAHERVLFESFTAQSRGAISSQALLEPATVHLTPAQAEALRQQLPILKKLGFEVEAFGPGAYQVRSIPEMFAGLHPEAALRALVEDFEEDEEPFQSEVEARLIARVCKRAAVKSGQVLSPEEQRALVRGLESCRSPRTCPHGRPTMIHLPVEVLERQFHRR